MRPTRIVIADEHALSRQALRQSVDKHPEFCIVAEATSGTQAIEIVHELALDVLLLDMHLGNMTGLMVLQRVGRAAKFKTILLGDLEPEDESKAVLLGASGVVRKSAVPETLFKSIESVLKGEIWAKRDLLKDLLAILRHSSNSSHRTNGRGTTRSVRGSRRARLFLCLLCFL
jgi:DNA-binding NarL/FixJ family response regulator